MALQSFCGRVVKKPFARGSKSERNAVVLKTPDGDFLLRRRGGNPFRDAVLDSLVGEEICCQGVKKGDTLHLESWRVT